jgi:hypothetical protein
MRTKKNFDCVEMKRRAQARIREALRGRTRAEEIEFFRRGAEEFQRRLDAARAKARRKSE